jgi:hypothetical protein
MKFLGWILFCAINSQAFAQGVVIEPAPLSVEDNGTRKIIDRKEGEVPAVENPKDIVAPPLAEALVIPNDDVINPPDENKKEVVKKAAKISQPVPVEVSPVIAPASPIDGQLRLDGPSSSSKKLVEIEIQNTVVAQDEAPTNIDILAIGYVENPLKKYLQFSFGYINSRYEKIHPSLDNGSTMSAFRFVADMTPSWQSGFAVELLADTSGQTIPDNIRVVQYRIFADHHAVLFHKGALKLDWVGGLSFSIGDFGIRRRFLNSMGQEVSVKLKDGIMVGLIPAAGLRIYLNGQNSVDFMVEYHQYFGKPQKYIGGLAISPRLSFEF